jgi:hypothetical protein
MPYKNLKVDPSKHIFIKSTSLVHTHQVFNLEFYVQPTINM